MNCNTLKIEAILNLLFIFASWARMADSWRTLKGIRIRQGEFTSFDEFYAALSSTANNGVDYLFSFRGVYSGEKYLECVGFAGLQKLLLDLINNPCLAALRAQFIILIGDYSALFSCTRASDCFSADCLTAFGILRLLSIIYCEEIDTALE